MVCRGWFVTVISSDLNIAKTSPLQHQHKLILAIVFQILGANFFLEQLSTPPQPGSDLAGGNLFRMVQFARAYLLIS
jgi:hypothetical protein